MEGENCCQRRKSIRLKEYDYSKPGYYFVTICTQNRENILGEIHNGTLSLTTLGKLAEYTWYDLPNHNSHIGLDEFVVMPNHIHGIIIINDIVVNSAGAGSEPAPTNTPTNALSNDIKPTRHGLPEIIRQFKTFSARRINEKRKVKGRPVWQRNYFEHIIRNDHSLNQIRQYIINNPINWEKDKNNF